MADNLLERWPHPGGWIRDGLAAGFLGYVSSSVVYALIDRALGRSLFFASRTLGAELLGGALVRVHPVLASLSYDAIRLVVLWGVGFGMSLAIRHSERRPRLSLLTLLGGASALAVSEGVLAILAHPVSAAHWWWVVLAANLVAGLAMGVFVIHRFLLRQLHEMAKHMS